MRLFETRRRAHRVSCAAEVAWRLERLISRGIQLREQGWCLGELRSDEVAVQADGTVAAGPRATPSRRYAAHLRRGHDDGCLALGTPRSAASSLVVAWDGVGSTQLIMEAFDDAVAEMQASPADWESGRARDAFAYAVRSRITPCGG